MDRLYPEEDNVGLSDVGGGQVADNNKNRFDKQFDNRQLPDWEERIDASIARSSKVRGFNYGQLSTINVYAMGPRCWTVVFRCAQNMRFHNNPPPLHCTLLPSYSWVCSAKGVVGQAPRC
jgi:hypothetical protein